MGDKKHHQPPMTIDEQIENLKELGLIVKDEAYAKKILTIRQLYTITLSVMFIV